jgi:hypothetical protein
MQTRVVPRVLVTNERALFGRVMGSPACPPNSLLKTILSMGGPCRAARINAVGFPTPQTGVVQSTQRCEFTLMEAAPMPDWDARSPEPPMERSKRSSPRIDPHPSRQG